MSFHAELLDQQFHDPPVFLYSSVFWSKVSPLKLDNEKPDGRPISIPAELRQLPAPRPPTRAISPPSRITWYVFEPIYRSSYECRDEFAVAPVIAS
jgi:hypothetical protein